VKPDPPILYKFIVNSIRVEAKAFLFFHINRIS
jgi:hypothetical protein